MIIRRYSDDFDIPYQRWLSIDVFEFYVKCYRIIDMRQLEDVLGHVHSSLRYISADYIHEYITNTDAFDKKDSGKIGKMLTKLQYLGVISSATMQHVSELSFKEITML
jgi:hypothetical protein